jgi:predicted alpha/beta superfamily hydrolase
MRIPSLTVFLLLATSSANASVDTEFLQGLGDTRYHYIESENVGRGYHVFVSLPNDYDQSSKKTYPTIYLLDGGSLFPTLSAYYRSLQFGEGLPGAIIVGISYGSDDFENGNYRSTDFTVPSSERAHYGGAETYQRFLSDELLPFIESKYASREDRRIIFGSSLGGQFVLFTALTQPTLFWGHIANNPALHRNLPFFLQHHAKQAPDADQSKLFVGDGTLNDARYRVPSRKWISYWTDRDDKPWALMTMDLEGHTHMSSSPASFRQGMRWLFSED